MAPGTVFYARTVQGRAGPIRSYKTQKILYIHAGGLKFTVLIGYVLPQTVGIVI